MKIFYHINELGYEGYHSLPIAIQISSNVQLWSPSPLLMNKTYLDLIASGVNSKVNPLLRSEDLLELIQDGHVQILGRDNWLSNSNSRKDHAWEFAEWDKEFDTKIKNWSETDRNKKLLEKRVVLFPEERGNIWANEIFDSSDDISKMKVEKAKQLVTSKRLSSGVKEQIDRLNSEADKIRLLLRMTYNHLTAFNDSGANKTIDNIEWEKISFELYPEGLHKYSQINKPSSNSRFLEILDTLKSIAKPRNAEEIKKLKTSKNLKIFQNDIENMMYSDINVNDLISSELRDGFEKEANYIETLFGATNFEKTYTLLSIILSFATFTLNPVGALSFTLAVIPQSLKFAEKKSLIGISNYSGYKSPFILANGSESITYKKMQELYDRFQSMKIPD